MNNTYSALWIVVLLFISLVVTCFKKFGNTGSTKVLFARRKDEKTYFYSLSRTNCWTSIALTN